MTTSVTLNASHMLLIRLVITRLISFVPNFKTSIFRVTYVTALLTVLNIFLTALVRFVTYFTAPETLSLVAVCRDMILRATNVAISLLTFICALASKVTEISTKVALYCWINILKVACW